MSAADRAARALDSRLDKVRNWQVMRPQKGWIRAVRDALGLTTRQYAQRLGLSQARVVALEKGEVDGSLTLASLRSAAEGLNCELVYVFIPREPLTETLRKQAGVVADEQLDRVAHTMRLENQAVTEDEIAREREAWVDRLLRGNLADLWRSKP
jgi:predicted DNA-binding mobile mystery protein A